MLSNGEWDIRCSNNLVNLFPKEERKGCYYKIGIDKAKKILEILSDDYSIPPPAVKVGDTDGHRGMYIPEDKTVVMRGRNHIKTIFHEFYHHLDEMTGGKYNSDDHEGNESSNGWKFAEKLWERFSKWDVNFMDNKNETTKMDQLVPFVLNRNLIFVSRKGSYIRNFNGKVINLSTYEQFLRYVYKLDVVQVIPEISDRVEETNWIIADIDNHEDLETNKIYVMALYHFATKSEVLKSITDKIIISSSGGNSFHLRIKLLEYIDWKRAKQIGIEELVVPFYKKYKDKTFPPDKLMPSKEEKLTKTHIDFSSMKPRGGMRAPNSIYKDGIHCSKIIDPEYIKQYQVETIDYLGIVPKSKHDEAIKYMNTIKESLEEKKKNKKLLTKTEHLQKEVKKLKKKEIITFGEGKYSEGKSEKYDIAPDISIEGKITNYEIYPKGEGGPLLFKGSLTECENWIIKQTKKKNIKKVNLPILNEDIRFNTSSCWLIVSVNRTFYSNYASFSRKDNVWIIETEDGRHSRFSTEDVLQVIRPYKEYKAIAGRNYKPEIDELISDTRDVINNKKKKEVEEAETYIPKTGEWCLIPKKFTVEQIKAIGVEKFYSENMYKKMIFLTDEEASAFKVKQKLEDYKVKRYYGAKKLLKKEKPKPVKKEKPTRSSKPSVSHKGE